jgi:hypothetical protein
MKLYHQELPPKQEQNKSPEAMQKKKPQPRDPDMIIIDIPNTFYFQQKYNDLNEYKDYNSNPTTTFMSSKEELDL